MSHLFISYSRQDSKEVDPLSKRLEQAGHNVWLDRSAIQGGSRWQEEIVRGIERADVFLVILSPESIKSENVEKEIGLAYVRNKPILPVMLHHVDAPSQLQYAFAGREIIDISAAALEVASSRLLSAISSPGARTRKIYVGERWRQRVRRYLAWAIWLAIFTLIRPEWPPPARDYWLVGAILSGVLVWVARKRLASRLLSRRGMVFSTDFKGFFGQDPLQIVSEWRDPATGDRYEFHSESVNAEFSEFVEAKIPVLADPKNFKTYRVDLSFLPKTPRGALGLHGKDDTTGAGGGPLSTKKRSPGHIFVSFSEQDCQAVKLLVRELQAAGHAVWSTRGANQGDRELQEQVVSGIGEARLFLLVLSPESAASERVESELELAAAKTKPIVTVLLRRTTIPENMNYTLVGAPHIDLSENFDTGVARLLETAAAGSSKATASSPRSETAVPAASSLERITAFFGFEGRRSRLLMAHGTPLLTDYKHVHVSSRTIEGTEDQPGEIVVEGRILTQWRHPVSHELYLFRSAKVSPDAGDSIKTRTITVYVDPENMGRYHMDISFLPENRRQTKRKKRKEEPAANIAPSARTAEARGIFVSYSERDAAKAALLMQELESQGHELLNRAPAPDSHLSDEAIRKPIESARAFLLLVPPQDANDLDDKTKELRIALASQVRIVPLSFGDSPTPLCMQLALSGIQRIVLSQDPQAGIQPLLCALASMSVQRTPAQSSPSASSRRPVSKSFLVKLREPLTGAWIGWLSWGVGCLLPVLFSAHGWETSLGVGITAVVPGGIWGAVVYKRKVSIRIFAPVVAISGFIAFVFAYLVFVFLLSLSAASNERMLLGALLGCGTFLLVWVLEMRWFDSRLKKNGRLLLTEYKGIRVNTSESHNNRHFVRVVSEWRDPMTDRVYEFLSRDFANDPSERIRSSTIAVFVDPNNFEDYYMDLSYSAKTKKDSSPDLAKTSSAQKIV